jgi:DNA repair exonuclease SbcCD nuclease subunit
MKTLRFLHTADWHADNDPVKQEKLRASLEQILNYVKENKVNALIHAGDIWEKKQSYAENSGVPLVILYLKAISKYVDFIFITKGNNSHDEPGSVSLLHQIEPNIYAYEHPVCLGIESGTVEDMLSWIDVSYEVVRDFEYIISLVPYPTKSMFVKAQSIDLNNNEFIGMFEQIFELIGDLTQPYTCPKIIGFHGNVVGSRLSSGQSLVSQDIMVAPATLQKSSHDYYALGHIHLRQEVAPNMVFSGSIYNKSWGETEQKSFEVIEFTGGNLSLDGTMERKQILLSSAKPMIKLDAEFKNGNFYYPNFEHDHDGIPEPTNPNAEYRLRIKVNENDRKLITDAKIQQLKDKFGDDVKLELNVTPNERESRSEQIMNCRTLIDEVREYANVIEQPINGTIESKVAQLQEGVGL